MMWSILFFSVLAAFVAGIYWLSGAVCKFHCLQKTLPHAGWKRHLLGLLAVMLLVGILVACMDVTNAIICFLHLLFFWLLCEVLFSCWKRFTGKSSQFYWAGVCAILFTTVWLGIGWYNAHHVSSTCYTISTEKDLGVSQLRIVGLSDSHVGATFHWQEFEQYIEEINKQNPDAVVIMGDFVDDDTSKEDMEKCCKALSRLHPKYGVHYVYGNHDGGYFNNSGRGYTLEELDLNLTENGVHILRDETIPLVGNIYLCGRLDKSRDRENRKSASALMNEAKVKDTDYVITMDHEPNDYAAEAASGMDLVISGHTHGGQFIGLGTMGVLMGANDFYYGHEHRLKTDFIVSSGIADWALKFKTGCISEYIIIDLKN